MRLLGSQSLKFALAAGPRYAQLVGAVALSGDPTTTVVPGFAGAISRLRAVYAACLHFVGGSLCRNCFASAQWRPPLANSRGRRLPDEIVQSDSVRKKMGMAQH